MAVDFDGDMLKVTSGGDELRDLSAVTFMVWVNLDSISDSQGILSINAVPYPYRKVLAVSAAPPAIRLSAMLVEYSGNDSMAFGMAPQLGGWHHLCGRWAHSETPSEACPDIFLDGVDQTVSRTTPSGTCVGDSGVIAVGGSPVDAGSTGYIDGVLADASVFDRKLADDEIRAVASGRLRASHLDPLWHLTLEQSAGTTTIGDIALRDTTGRGNHIDAIDGTPSYHRDPPLHWPIAPEEVPYTEHEMRNSRPTMDVAVGRKLATMRRAM